MDYILEALRELKTLTEDISAVKNNFPKIDDDTFMSLIKLDPTYKEGSNSVGTYGKWILNLYNKGKLKESDFDLVDEALRLFEEKKKWFTNKDIGQFKTLDELQKGLDEVEVGEVSHARQVKDVRKKAKETNLVDDADLIYEDNKWIVYIPKTYEASCKLGQGSKWCTATKETDNYYKQYTEDGPLYIIINKNNLKEKYQLHEESQSFMDINDESFEPSEQFNNDEDIKLLSFLKSKIDFPPSYIEVLKQIFNVDKKDSNISYVLDMDDVQDYLILESNNRNKINLNYALEDHYDWFIDNYNDISLNDFDYNDIDDDNKELMLKISKQEGLEDIDYELFENVLMISVNEGIVSGSYGDYINSVNHELDSIMNKYKVNIQVLDESTIKIFGTLESIYKLTKEIKKRMIDEAYIYNEYDDIKGIFNAIVYNSLNENFDLEEPYYGWQGFDEEAFNQRLSDELYEQFELEEE